MIDFRIAVKSFIVFDNKILILKRVSSRSHYAGRRDIPGGRMELGEDPVQGVIRETKEEVGLDIEVIMPLEVHHFTRDDGQIITMIIFLCKALSNKVELSLEHQSYEWVDLNSDIGKFPDWLRAAVKIYDIFGLERGMMEDE